MAKQITTHQVPGDPNSANLEIHAVDAMGVGGAYHSYQIVDVSRQNVAADPDNPGDLMLCEIEFQNGPIADNGINGVTHEVLLAIVLDRLECFQAGPYPCEENMLARDCVGQALEHLKTRTKRRLAQQLEGKLSDWMPTPESSNVRRFRYDEKLQELTVMFGKPDTPDEQQQEYTYLKVPPSVYADLLKAGSRGSFVAKSIKPNYEFRRPEPKKEEEKKPA